MIATDAAGNVLWKENHRPYGERVLKQAANNNSTNKIGFAGKPFDNETGLSYMGARYYNPVIGRFMGIDPVGFQENNIHSFNRYAYANNNPYKFVDPDGRQAVEAFILGGVLIAAGGGIYINIPGNWTKMQDSAARLYRAVKNVVFSESADSGDKAKPDSAGASNSGDTKPPLSDYKDALGKVHDKVGKLPKGEEGKFGSPQAGDSKKGYRLDPPHDGVAKGDAESKHHFNWWDYSRGKRGNGGESGAIPIGN